MIIGECKIGNTIIRCDDSCVRSPEEVEKIRENLAAFVARHYARQIEKEQETGKQENAI